MEKAVSGFAFVSMVMEFVTVEHPSQILQQPLHILSSYILPDRKITHGTNLENFIE